MQDGTDSATDSASDATTVSDYASDATVVQESHTPVEDPTESDTESDTESEDESECCAECPHGVDVVQCVTCLRTYCRRHWSDWAVVVGHEAECESCVVHHHLVP